MDVVLRWVGGIDGLTKAAADANGLSDGIIFMEILQKIDPDFFSVLSAGKKIEENRVLRAQFLKRLQKSVVLFYSQKHHMTVLEPELIKNDTNSVLLFAQFVIGAALRSGAAAEASAPMKAIVRMAPEERKRLEELGRIRSAEEEVRTLRREKEELKSLEAHLEEEVRAMRVRIDALEEEKGHERAQVEAMRQKVEAEKKRVDDEKESVLQERRVLLAAYWELSLELNRLRNSVGAAASLRSPHDAPTVAPLTKLQHAVNPISGPAVSPPNSLPSSTPATPASGSAPAPADPAVVPLPSAAPQPPAPPLHQ